MRVLAALLFVAALAFIPTTGSAKSKLKKGEIRGYGSSDCFNRCMAGVESCMPKSGKGVNYQRCTKVCTGRPNC